MITNQMEPGKSQSRMLDQSPPRLPTYGHLESLPHQERHTLFEEYARQQPPLVAVMHGETQITYDDLNRRANHLAWYLLSLDIGQRELIGVCLGRSIECVAALLAVAKLGCVYLPIDPSLPSSVKAEQLKGARCILTVPRFATNLPQDQLLVYLDEDWRRAVALPSENPPGTGNSCLIALIPLLVSWLK